MSNEYKFLKDGFKLAVYGDDVIEGFLNVENKAEVLFLMREPHNDEQKDFWLKRVVSDKLDNVPYEYTKGNGTRFFNTFNCFLKALYKSESEELLRDCAYINLFPFSGKAKASSLYLELIGGFSKADTDYEKHQNTDAASSLKELAALRYLLLHQLTENGVKYIFTTREIFDALMKLTDKKKTEIYLKYEGRYTKEFRSFDFINNSKVYEFYHPSATVISYKKLKSALKSAKF